MSNGTPAADVNDVIRSIPEDKQELPRDQFRTSNGILFKLKPVPPLLLNDVGMILKEPVPPKVPNLDKDPDGSVLEENPHDPNYVREQLAYQRKLGDISNGIMLSRGAEVLERPTDVEGVDSTDWSDDLKVVGFDIPAVGRQRYFSWMKYVALTSMEDFSGILTKISNLSGVTMEADAAKAADNFRSDAEGSPALGIPPVEEDGQRTGDLIIFPRPSTGVGVSGGG